MSDMPDVIWVEKNVHQFYDGFSEEQHVPLTKYLCADPVIDLLKQAREIVDIYHDEYGHCDELLEALNKFLEETK